MLGTPFEKHDVVRVAIVGLGSRQSTLLSSLVKIAGARVEALCDLNADRVSKFAESIRVAGHEVPHLYSGPDALQNLRADAGRVDLAIIATAWTDHAWIAIDLMNAGLHVAVEVPAAVTIEDCWALVDASERTKRHCVMLENCSYGDEELLMLNMVRAGVFGELVHADASYIHDLRNYYLEKPWRLHARAIRNGNLYPTHGLAPVANYLQINRGDRFVTMASLSSAAIGLQSYFREIGHEPEEAYVAGDMNVSILRTARGRTVMLQHDEVSPRPYNRHNVISGDKGYASGFANEVYLQSEIPALGIPVSHDPQPLDAMREQYEHRFWALNREQALLGGHGGIDYIMLWRLIDTMLNGREPDMDVYDAAVLSSIGPLSERSNGELAFVDVPDFTRGRWADERVAYM
ncbi:putative dehydrogenase [Microbacterium sp. W4I4]|uniref:Gfo/Idh/MocA family protein n=1 Tax=Microbacterium sp. W4I4 TaxID=3042295 RepID=UPI00278AA399|nr:Gfo/Idh/MocA family oxidoreductase [Microbacterium sp. W4I4]MDQ0614008.1 putative dehydrogenase [Microbacterium sp. W4I4]